MSRIQTLLNQHRQNVDVIESSLFMFIGFEGYDVYNISQAFEYNDKTYLFGRVEKPDSEISKVVLFEKIKPYVYQKTDVTIKDLQDPSLTKIDDTYLLCGTKIEHHNQKITSWATAFYKGKTIDNLKFFFESPEKMKDVRLFKDQTIHAFTRPQGYEAKLGKIGYCQFESLKDLTKEAIEKAKLLNNNFEDDSWGGVNQVHLLKNGYLGILGHISTMSHGNVRHYYAMTFLFDPKNPSIQKLKIIAERKDFPNAKSKRPDLKDVIFPGGLVRHDNQLASLYAGLSDAASGVLLIKDPFVEYEN